MDERYTRLGFKVPDFVENQYGIKIYIGTKGKDDWCVEVPQRLGKEEYKKKFKDNLIFFMVSEDFALELARDYTNRAIENKKIREMEAWYL